MTGFLITALCHCKSIHGRHFLDCSQGQRVGYKGKEVRVVGIDSDGFLHIVDRGKRKSLSTTEGLVWGFGNNVVTD